MAFGKVTLTGAVDTIKEGFTKINSLITDLLSTDSGKGASQIGIEDSAGNLSSENLEDAIAEIYSDVTSSVTFFNSLDEKSSTTTGLTWGYQAGLLRVTNSIVAVTTGTVGLTDDAVNYVEIKTDGTVTKNTVGFTSGRLALRLITCASGVQTVSTDKRAWFQLTEVPLPVDEGGSGQTTYTDGQVLIGNTTGSTLAKATLTGTVNQITITNGHGSITLSLPADVLIPTVITTPNEGLHILDTDASHDLIVKAGSDLSADRILSLITGDSARTITLSGNPTLSDWFDQAIKQASSPTFAAITLTAALTVPNGGTGAQTLTDHGILFGSGTGAVTPSAVMSNGQVLIGQTGADSLPKTLSGAIAIDEAGVATLYLPDAVVGDYLECQRDTSEKGVNNNSYEKKLETYATRGGAYRISFTIFVESTIGVKAKIHRNGAAVGTERSLTGNTSSTYSEDISGWTRGDLIQVYAYYYEGTPNPPSNESKVKDLYLYTGNPIA